MKPSPSAVAAVVSPTARIGLLRCSARFGQRARAVGAAQQHGLAGGEDGGEVGRRTQDFQPEQRRDDRRMAALG